MSRFRYGCCGLQADIVRVSGPPVERDGWHCLTCRQALIEDEHHFLFACPAYDSIRGKFDAVSGDLPQHCLLSLPCMTP